MPQTPFVWESPQRLNASLRIAKSMAMTFGYAMTTVALFCFVTCAKATLASEAINSPSHASLPESFKAISLLPIALLLERLRRALGEEFILTKVRLFPDLSA